jgi:hypothetical protein
MLSTTFDVALKRSGLAACALLLLASVAGAQNQPLGEIAKKEQERRKASPESGKVYTNKDLPQTAQKPADGAKAAPATPGEPSSAIPGEAEAGVGEKSGEAKPAASDAAKGEAAWRKRMSDAREELRRQEMFVQALQTRVNSLTQDVLSRSDPVQKSRLAGERKEALNEMARVRQEIEASKKAIADIEEEARKAGVPPGWLR